MKIARRVEKLALSLSRFIPDALLNLAARVAIFMIFWSSVQTKISGASFFGQRWQFWNVSDATFALFEYKYALPLIPASIASYMATFSEFFFSLFILLGIFTRASALGLILITLVIQIFVYPGAWATHLLWLVPLVYLLKAGGDSLSLDRQLLQRA